MQDPQDHPEEPHHLAPQPRRRRVWPWVLAVVLAIIILIPVGLILLVEMSFSHIVRQSMQDFALEHEMVIEGSHEVSASLLGSSLVISDTALRDVGRGDSKPFLRFESLNIDTSLWAALRGHDLVVDLIELQAPQLDLRRRADGSIPGIPRDMQQQWQPEEWPPALLLLAGALDRGRSILQQQALPGEQEQVVSLRRLHLAQGSLRFPDILVAQEQAEEPTCVFSLDDITIEAEDISSHPRPGQEQRVHASLRSAGAGHGEIRLQHAPQQGGSFTLLWTDMPLAHIAHPAMSGDLLSAYGPTGTGNLQWKLQWDEAGQLSGTLTVSLYDLRINPQDARDQQLQQLAALMRQQEGSLFTWEVPFSGSLEQPEAADLTWEGFLEAMRQHYIDGPDDML